MGSTCASFLNEVNTLAGKLFSAYLQSLAQTSCLMSHKVWDNRMFYPEFQKLKLERDKIFTLILPAPPHLWTLEAKSDSKLIFPLWIRTHVKGPDKGSSEVSGEVFVCAGFCVCMGWKCVVSAHLRACWESGRNRGRCVDSDRQKGVGEEDGFLRNSERFVTGVEINSACFNVQEVGKVYTFWMSPIVSVGWLSGCVW